MLDRLEIPCPDAPVLLDAAPVVRIGVHQQQLRQGVACLRRCGRLALSSLRIQLFHQGAILSGSGCFALNTSVQNAEAAGQEATDDDANQRPHLRETHRARLRGESRTEPALLGFHLRPDFKIHRIRQLDLDIRRSSRPHLHGGPQPNALVIRKLRPDATLVVSCTRRGCTVRT